MDIVEQILIGLATTFVGIVIGTIWQAARRGGVYWGSRRFWKPLLCGKLTIVADKFGPDNAPQLEGWEVSGLVGGGGMQAALAVVELLEDIGLQRPGRRASIVYGDDDDEIGKFLETNLFCIGGPDANKVTENILRHAGYPIPENRGLVPGLQPGRVYEKNSGADANDGKNIMIVDYGRLIRIRNPYNEDRCVFILWGNSGYGTWGAAKLLRSRKLRSWRSVKRGLDVEINFQTEIISRVAQEPSIIDKREISSRVPDLAVEDSSP
jgi:hypothetical protein